MESEEFIDNTIDLSIEGEIFHYFIDLTILDSDSLEENETPMTNYQLLKLAIELQRNRIEIEKFNLSKNGAQ